MKTEMISKPTFRVYLSDEDRKTLTFAADILNDIIEFIYEKNGEESNVKAYKENYTAISSYTTHEITDVITDFLADLSDAKYLEFEGENDSCY